MNRDLAMINHSLHQPTHHLRPAIACVAIGLFSAVPAQAQGETQCTVETPDGWLPLPGVSSFSASVTRSWVGTNPCLGEDPPPPCSGLCHFEVGGLVGRARASFCATWIPVTKPTEPFYPGYWCEPSASDAIIWLGNRSGVGAVYSIGNDTIGASTTASVEISFGQPVVTSVLEGWVSGGRFLNGFLYVNPGETVALRAEGGSSIRWNHALCPDTDLNGICDEYDDAARAFGDFDSSGSVDGADLAALLDAWGTAGSVCDISYNGVVDGGDLAFLLSRWGQGAS